MAQQLLADPPVDLELASGPVAPGKPPLWARLLMVLLAAVFLGSGLLQASRDSPTVDEGVDLAAGVSYWVHHDLRMSPEHPVLPKLAAALPALLADPIVPKAESWQSGDWFDYTGDFLKVNDQADRLRRVLFLSRLVPLLEGAACGALIYWLAKRLVGWQGAVIAAGIWFTTPYFLGLSHVQSLDISFTLATLTISAALLLHRSRPDLAHAALVGVALAATLATRHTGVVLLPVAAVVVGVAGLGGRRAVARQVGLVMLVAFLGLFVLYRGFDATAPTGEAGSKLHAIVDQASAESVASKLVLALPAPLEWRAGFGYLRLTSVPRPSWLFGQAWEGSRFWYFPGNVLARVPFGAVLLLVLGPIGWVWRVGRHRRNALLVVALPALAIFGAMLVQPLNLGARLVLPSVALLCVAAAPAADWLRRTWGRVLLRTVAVTQIVAVIAAGSLSLAWTPPPFTPSYQYVTDTDFGQDLWRLRSWAVGRDPWVSALTPRGLSLPANSKALKNADPSSVTGFVAVSVVSLNVTDRDELSWLRAYCPVDFLGSGSILIYRFDQPPSARPGPDRPVESCTDQSFSERR